MRNSGCSPASKRSLLLGCLAIAVVAVLCWAAAPLLRPTEASSSGSTEQELLGAAAPEDEPLLEALCQRRRQTRDSTADSVSGAHSRGSATSGSSGKGTSKASGGGSGSNSGSSPVSTATQNAAEEDSFRGSDGSDQYFAMVLVVKDAHDDIREWVAHHQSVGAGTLYVYDTGSRPPLKDNLVDFIDSGLVKYHWWVPDFGDGKNKKRPQMEVWKAAIRDYGSRHQFLGFFDADEFLIPNGGYSTVPQLLRRLQGYEPIGGLVVSWVMFGSSGHKTKPKGGVLQAYTKCMPLRNQHGIHVKSIVNTEFVDHPLSPHHFKYKAGKYAVTEHFQRLNGATVVNITGAPTVDYLGAYHYFTKSEEEFKAKQLRGSAMGNHKEWKYFESVDDESTLDCLGATQYVYS